MKTLFGKELAKIRLDNNITMKDMAHALQVKSSYLSAVESNSKKLSSNFLEKILSYLSLSEQENQRLRGLATLSTGEYVIDTSPLEEKHLDTLTMFAKKIGDLSDEQRNKIKDLLKQGD